MTGVDALIALREGKAIRRSIWLNGMVIRVIDNELSWERHKHRWPCREHNCSIQNMLHDDWEVAEVKDKE